MITAIVLAAGASTRMGTQKLLLPLRGSTVIECVVDELLASPVDAVVVVLGHDAAAVRARMGARRVAFIENPAPEQGMLSSVRCGLRAVPSETAAVVVALGDHPQVSREVVKALVRAHRAGARLAVPRYGGRRGHPLLFGTEFTPEVLSSFEDTGLRGLLATHAQALVEVEAADPAVLSDLDTPEDYRVLQQQHSTPDKGA